LRSIQRFSRIIRWCGAPTLVASIAVVAQDM